MSTYTERLRIGYRWYNENGVKPAYAFGHGLSYTTFGYSQFSAKPTGSGEVVATAVIANLGLNYTGVETVQLYVTFPAAADEPPRQLKGVAKTANLAPGAAASVQFRVSARDLSIWSVAAHDWQAVHGLFLFELAASSADVRATASVNL